MMLYCAGASGVRPPGNIAGNEDHSWARPSTASIQALAGQDYPSGILWAGPQPQAEGLSNLPYGLCDAFHGQTDAQLRDFAFAPEEVTFLETVLRRKSDDGSSNRQLNQYGFTNAAMAPVAPPFDGRCFERQTLPDFASTTMPNQSAQNPIGSATTTNTTTATAVSPFGPHSAPFLPPGYNSSLCLANAVSAPITMTTCTNALPSNPDQPRPQFNVGRSGSAADHCLRLVRPSPLRICNPHRDNFLPPTSQQYWITNVPSWISCPSSLTTCAAASAPAPPPPTAAAAAAVAVPATVPWPWSASQIQSSWQQQQPQQQQPQQQPQQQQQQQQLKALPAQHPALHHHPHSLLLRSQPQRQSLPPRPSINTAILNDDSMLDEMLLEEIKAAPWPTTNLRQCGTTGCICARDGVLGGGSAAPSPGASDSVCAQMPSTGMAITLSKMATASVEAPPKPTQPTGGASISFHEPFVWSPNTSFAGPVQPMVWGPPPGNHTQTDLTAQHPAIAVPTTQSQRSAVPCALPQLPPAPGATGLSSRNANYVDIAAANGSTSAPATASPSADLGSLPPLWYSSPQQQPPQVKSDTHSQPPQAMDPRLQNPQPTAQPSNSRRVMARPAARRPTHALRGGGPFALLPQPTAAIHHLHSSGSLDRSSADTQTRLEGAASAGGGEGGRSAGSIVAPATETSLASDAGGIIAGTAMAARSGRSRQSLTLEALRAMFELPAQDVVVALGISATDLKRRCRALGIRRWPHRKLASLKRLAEAIEADDEIGQEERQVVLDRVAANRSKIFADPDAEFDPGLKSLRQVQYKRHFVERQHGVVL